MLQARSGQAAGSPSAVLDDAHGACWYSAAQIGRMLASYRQYSDDQLMESYKQFSTVLKAFLKGE